MKIAVINFSGNVGKSTFARHLLLPRLPGAELIAIESLNAGAGGPVQMRGRQFGELQEYLQTIDSAVIDIGASNVEDLIGRMQRYRHSQEDFDCFVVPTVPAAKQQQDTIATLLSLADLGVSPSRMKLVFNMVEDAQPVQEAFALLLAFLAQQPIALANPACCIGENEVYARLRGVDTELAALASDPTDYKRLIVQAKDTAEKLVLAQRLATRRLAMGVVPELDACFEALALARVEACGQAEVQGAVR